MTKETPLSAPSAILVVAGALYVDPNLLTEMILEDQGDLRSHFKNYGSGQITLEQLIEAVSEQI